MTGDDLVRLIALLLIVLAVGGSLFMGSRQRLGQLTQYAAIWGLIFLGTIAVIGLWPVISATVMPRQTQLEGGVISVPADNSGHYQLVLQVNDTPVKFVVDTGATDMVLSADDAQRVGIEVDRLVYTGRAQTANGTVRLAPVRLDRVVLGDFIQRNQSAVVNEGELNQSLLGISYLRHFQRIEIANGQLLLTP